MKIFLIVLTSALAIFGWFKPKTIPRWLSATFIIIVIAALIVQLAVELKQSKESDKSQYSGTLSTSPSQQNKIIIQIGDSETSFVLDSHQPGASLLNALLVGSRTGEHTQIAKENRFSVTDTNGKLKVSAIIRGYGGSMIAEIQDNEWKVNPQMAWDRNYADDALEVKDNHGDVVLQVKLLPDRVQLQARFRDSQGNGIAFVKAPNIDGAFMEILSDKKKQFEIPITPLFRYPSHLHFGEYTDEK